MTAMTTTLHLPLAVDGWIVDDVAQLPEGLHYELVDGVLHVSPPAPLPHNAAATELSVVLHPLVGPEWRVTHYWRLEPEAPVLVTHVLDGDVYRESGRFTDEVHVSEPVAVRFRLQDLLV